MRLYSVIVLFCIFVYQIIFVAAVATEKGTCEVQGPESLCEPHSTGRKVFKDCKELYDKGYKTDGIYAIDPKNSGRPFKVYCDMKTSGGGWTVLQRRVDDSENFYRDWSDYEKGFGFLDGNMWLGLKYIHMLTSIGRSQLYIGMEDFRGTYRYARYHSFSVSDYKDYYRLRVSGYSGTAGDSMKQHNNARFSTRDEDNDNTGKFNCARLYRGGWWYGSCHSANPNGLYHGGSHKSYADGINWHSFRGYNYSLKRIFLLVRRI